MKDPELGLRATRYPSFRVAHQPLLVGLVKYAKY